MARWFRSPTFWLVALCAVFTFLASKKGYEAAGALRLSHLWSGSYWRLFTTILVHGDWLHFGFNAFGLIVLGNSLGLSKDLGTRRYVLLIVLGSWAALAASFFWNTEPIPRVGISGGITALVGLLVAEEWRVARNLIQFLKSRNTIVLAIVIALNLALTMWLEKANPGMRVDHAGHAGGFAFGILTGLALFGVRETGGERALFLRSMPGMTAACLLGILPIAYVCFPWWEPGYFLWRGMPILLDDGAVTKDEERREQATFYLGRAHELAPTHPLAAGGLAVLRDDASLLDGIRQPLRGELEFVGRRYLELAANRLADRPDEAKRLAQRATAYPMAPQLWISFAGAAQRTQRIDVADTAREIAWIRHQLLRQLRGPREGMLTEEQETLVASTLLGVYERRLAKEGAATAMQTIALAGIVARRVDEDSGEPDNKAALWEELIARVAGRVGAVQGRVEPAARPAVARGLRDLYARLEGVTRSDERAARYLLDSAEWWRKAAEGAGTTAAEAAAILARARAAAEEAEAAGAAKVAAQVRSWLARHEAELAAAAKRD